MPPWESLRQMQKAQTRARMLDAAVEVLARSSVLDVTMEDLASAAGVTRATLYAHFPRKVDVVRGIAERLYSVGEDLHRSLADVEVWDEQAVRTWLEDTLGAWRHRSSEIRVLRTATPVVSESAAAANDRYVEILASPRRRWAAVDLAESRQRILMALTQVESVLGSRLVTGELPGDSRPLDVLLGSTCYLLEPALGVAAGHGTGIT